MLRYENKRPSSCLPETQSGGGVTATRTIRHLEKGVVRGLHGDVLAPAASEQEWGRGARWSADDPPHTLTTTTSKNLGLPQPQRQMGRKVGVQSSGDSAKKDVEARNSLLCVRVYISRTTNRKSRNESVSGPRAEATARKPLGVPRQQQEGSPCRSMAGSDVPSLSSALRQFPSA